MGSEEKPHIVLFPYPGQGHIPPMIHFARRLARNGFIVTMVNIDSLHKNIAKQWVDTPGLDIRLEQVPCAANLPAGMAAESLQEDPAAVAQALHAIGDSVKELLGVLQPPPRCFVVDFFYSWHGQVAKEINVPLVTYFPGNTVWCSLHHHHDLMVANGDAHTGFEQGDKLITYIPGISPIRHEDIPEYFKYPLGEASVTFFKGTHEALVNSDWVLVNSLEELESSSFKAMQEALAPAKFLSVGPTFPPKTTKSLGISLRPEDDKCIKWLDTQPEGSVLYISFGSMSTLSEKAFEELAAGIEASKQPFLWVIRIDLVYGSSIKEKYKEFIERVQDQGLVVGWAPQVQVLAHSAVGGFFSHCGWNSIMESLCSGVPLLGWPGHSDQSMNCKLLEEDWKVGKRFSRQREVERGEVEKKIREFMDGEDMVEIRSRAKDFHEKASKTYAEGGKSYTNFESFMTAMK